MESSGQYLGKDEWGRFGEEVDGERRRMGRDVPPTVDTGNPFLLKARLELQVFILI